MAREKAKGGEPVDDMLPPRARGRNANGWWLGIRLVKKYTQVSGKEGD